jgi:hypothetical protein
MRFAAVAMSVVSVFALNCAQSPSSPPSEPQKHDVKIKVDKKTKKTKIRKVTAHRRDSVEFQALEGTVTIIIPDGRLQVTQSPEGSLKNFKDWFSLKLGAGESAVILIPGDFPDNRHDKAKNREIWYLVICGEGADSYPGESESPPRMIIKPR